uniref:Uncharacterized protein n=1 Tax=Cacopsylla melanoneura TaxID=428564 RepID=A0A8D8SF65_9HEMI
MCCSCHQVCTTSHVIFNLVYISIGTIQLVAGVFFFVSLPPLFRIGSNLWTGGWNVLFGVSGAVVTCVGTLSPSKQHILHYFTLSILCVNVVNLVILEIGEFRLFLPDTLRGENLSHETRFLLSCARMSSSMSTIVAIVCSFIDAQLTFCSIECTQRSNRQKKPEHEVISDADYILPRVKTTNSGSSGGAPLRPTEPGTNTKLHPAAHYTQSWVFDASHNPGDQPKTITLKRKRHNRSATDGAIKSPQPMVKSPNVLHPTSPMPGSAATPVVIVEDAGNTDRQLHFMTSFSRTPSPVMPHDESGSDSEMSSIQDFKDIRSQPVHDHLEKLTEPAIYRKRLDSARSSSSVTNRTSPPRSVSPRLATSEQPQYASLVMELEKTFARKRSVTEQEAPVLPDLQHRKSDAEFSKELEAALKSIESLESPQSVEMRSPPVTSPMGPPVGPSSIQFETTTNSSTTTSSNAPMIPKDHDSVEVRPWNAKVPDARGKPPPARSKSFVIRQDNGKTIINVKQPFSLENSPVPVHKAMGQPSFPENNVSVHRSIVQIVEDQVPPSHTHHRTQLKSKNSFKCSGVNYSSLPLPMGPRPLRSNRERKLEDSIKKKRVGNKSVGFRLENMPNNVRRAISFNTSNSQESDLDKLDDTNNSIGTNFRHRSTSTNEGTVSSQKQNLNRRSSNVVDYGSRYRTVDSSYGTLHGDSLSSEHLSQDSTIFNDTLINGSYSTNTKTNVPAHSKSNGVTNGHIVPVQSFKRKLNFSDVSNQPSESDDVDSDMLQVCFSEEESSTNETSYVIENNKNQNLELPHNQNLSSNFDNCSKVSNGLNCDKYGEAGGPGKIQECNNNLVQLPPTSKPSQPTKLQSRWSIKSLLRRKPSHPISLPPELEAAFLKSESLIFLTEEELIARYDSHKQTLRDIEQRTLQNMKASKKYQSSPDSDC